MTTDRYIIGETLRATLTVYFDGAAADPDTITAKAIDPAGTEHTVTPADETGTGNYSVAYTPSATDPTGIWRIRVTAVEGSNTEIEDIEFLVVA